MRTKLLLSFIIGFSILFSACKKDKNDTNDSDGGEDLYIIPGILAEPRPEVLFIGASYFVGLPELFNDFSPHDLLGNVYHCDSSIMIGRMLNYHATNQHTLNKIKERDWEYVVLQGVGINVAYPEKPEYYPYDYPSLFPHIKTIYDQIKDNYGNTKVVFCMPWAFEDGMTWVDGGTDTYFDMQEKIYHNTLALKDSMDIMIAPVGWAFNEIMKENPELHYLFKNDYNHPSKEGQYLMACVLYASIRQLNPANITHFNGVNVEEAIHLREVANNVVFDHFDLWNIPPIID